MKPVTRCIVIFLFLTIILTSQFTSFATDAGLTFETLSEDRLNTINSNLKIYHLTEEPERTPIKCFDVSDNRFVAVGMEKTNNMKVIAVYDSDFVFIYGYKFEDYGSFKIEWNEDDLNIYLIRSNLSVTMSPEGEILDIKEIEDTSENNSYRLYHLNSPKRVVGETEYLLKNDLGLLTVFSFMTYSQLVVTESGGEPRIVYDVNSYQMIRSIVIFLVVALFCSALVTCIVHEFKKAKVTSIKNNK